MRTIRLRSMTLALTLAAGLGLAACGGGGDEDDVAAPDIPDAPGLDELVSAAQEENCLTFYGVPEEDVLESVAAGFTDEYDIPVEFVRLVSADLQQRFSSEADAGAPAADLILLTQSPFYAEAYEEGWLTPVDEADVPALEEFPTEFLADDGATPVVSLVPTTMVYNSSLLEEAPTSWEAYAEPDNREELLFAEPASSPANYAFWQLMRDEYGDEFLQQVAANEPTWYNSAVPATQAVAAGEGALGFPGVDAIVKALQGEGAPVESARLFPTTGPEIAVGLTAGSECPSAARLFAHYLMTEVGNEYLNELSVAISPYAEDAAEFARFRPVADDQAAEIDDLLGSD